MPRSTRPAGRVSPKPVCLMCVAHVLARVRAVCGTLAAARSSVHDARRTLVSTMRTRRCTLDALEPSVSTVHTTWHPRLNALRATGSSAGSSAVRTLLCSPHSYSVACTLPLQSALSHVGTACLSPRCARGRVSPAPQRLPNGARVRAHLSRPSIRCLHSMPALEVPRVRISAGQAFAHGRAAPAALRGQRLWMAVVTVV